MTLESDAADHHAPFDAAPAEPAVPETIDDFASRAIEIATQRAAARAAGRQVPDTLPAINDRRQDARGRSPIPAVEAMPKSAALPAGTSAGDQGAAGVPAVEAPSGWSDDRKSSFGRLAPDAQKLLLEHVKSHDDDYGQRSRDLRTQAQQAEPFIRAYVDHADFLKRQSAAIGAAPHEIMSNVISILRTGTTGTPQERRQALGYVAYLFGIHPGNFGA